MMAGKDKIFTNNTLFRQDFYNHGADTYFVGRLRLKKGEEFVIHDLHQRGVTIFPSGLCQQISRSKVQQAHLLGTFMVPQTMVIFDQHDMLRAVNVYGQQQVTKVVTKDDYKDAGLGIFLWQSVEDVFTQASLGSLPYPFVLQPFIADCRDVRVVSLAGKYEEAYERFNPHNFRNNLHCGGNSLPYCLTPSQNDLCQAVLDRGDFPYGHIDLMITADGQTYLAEINLRGGVKGALIKGKEYMAIVDEIHQDFIDNIE